MVHAVADTALLDDLSRDVLREWAEHGEPTPDPGPVVLASTLPADDPAVARAARAWLAGLRLTANAHPGVFGGLAGHLAGLRLLAAVHPPLERAADAVAAALRRSTVERGGGVGFPDYDLIGGPAGVLLAHCVPDVRPGEVDALAGRLAGLCADRAEGLRCTAYDGHEVLGWMQGRVNAGLAHGVPGVAVALAAALRAGVDVVDGTGRPDAGAGGTGVPARSGAGAGGTGARAGTSVPAALRELGRWLVAEARCDPRGIVTWASAGGEPAPARAVPRQAWCYGCPGASWALWEAGAALREPGFTALGATAFRSLCANFDEDFHLGGDTAGDRLGVCHGAAGVLAVADAFATHAGLPQAGALRRRLSAHLRERADEVADLARTDMSVLNGAAGVLAALRTASGAARGWLPVVGLR